MSKVLVTYYSSYGHVFQLAKAVADGAREAGADVRLSRIAELEAAGKAMSSQPPYVAAQEQQKEVPVVTQDDLRWADAIAWGTPTRFGNMTAQMKQFFDTLGGMWSKGELEDKFAGVFTASSTMHGGQETTITTTMVVLLHLGFVLVGSPYQQNPEQFTTGVIGGSPYGPSTVAGGDGSLQPAEGDLAMSRKLGARLARFAARNRATG